MSNIPLIVSEALSEADHRKRYTEGADFTDIFLAILDREGYEVVPKPKSGCTCGYGGFHEPYNTRCDLYVGGLEEP